MVVVGGEEDVGKKTLGRSMKAGRVFHVVDVVRFVNVICFMVLLKIEKTISHGAKYVWRETSL